MEWQQIVAMLEHWELEPTVDQLAAWWLGYKPKKTATGGKKLKVLPMGRISEEQRADMRARAGVIRFRR